jgi:NAD(P)-dependent dehydrogenase (short-subunit alcohol dehydrogenase family)
VHNPVHPTAQALQSLSIGQDSRVIIVKIDAGIERDAYNAVQELQERHGLRHLDVVIANAGVAYVYPSIADLKLSDLRAHMEPNVYSPLALYQATRPLLKNPIAPAHLHARGIFGRIVDVSSSAFLFFAF